MSRTFKILISNWPRTRKFNRFYTCREGNRFWLFSPQSRVDHAPRPIFMLWLVKIWQLSSCGKFMQRLETCLLIAEADRVLCHLLMFLTVFFYLIHKMKYSCYQDCSVIHGLAWFVYCAFGWEMHRLSKSLKIRFRMASFSKQSKMSLLTCPCLRRIKRVEKSQAILGSLDDLQEQHLDW